MRFTSLVILSGLHGVADCYLMFLPALWMPLQYRFELSPLQTGLLMSVVLMPANLMQPLFGVVADRINAKLVVVLGPLLAVVCVSLLGLSPWLGLSVVMLMLGAAGTGMFHPEAVSLASRLDASGSSRATAWFLTGGFIGQAVGPWWISQVISGPGRRFEDSWQAAFPGLVILAVGVLMIRRLPHVAPSNRQERRPALRVILKGRYRPVCCLIGMNIARYFGLQLILFTIPLHVGAVGLAQMNVGQWMMVYIGAQGVGIILGGLTTPPHRERIIILLTLVAVLVPTCLLPFVAHNVAVLPLAAVGLGLAWSFPVAIQLAQEIVPGAQRWISGMMIGFSWGIGSLAAPPLVGYMCQTFSTQVPFIVAAGTLVVAIALAAAMPSQSRLNCLK